MPSKVSLPEIKSVICTSFTSNPAKNIAFAISRSELLPFSRIIAAFGLAPIGITGNLPSNCDGNVNCNACLSKLSKRSLAFPFFVCF